MAANNGVYLLDGSYRLLDFNGDLITTANPLPVIVGGSGASSTQVQGTAADGAAAVGNPVQIGGVDGSANAQSLLTDTSGRLTVIGSKTNNNAAIDGANIGVLSALANAANPSWTEGNQVALSVALDGKLRTVAPVSSTSGTITGNGQTVTLSGVAGYGFVIFQITGVWTATLQHEFSLDGTNFDQAQVVTGGGGSAWVTSSTTNRHGIFALDGAGSFRLRASAFTSGTATVTISAFLCGQKDYITAGNITADATAASGILGAAPIIFNAAGSWDRIRGFVAGDGIATGVLGVGIMAKTSGANTASMIQTAQSFADGGNGSREISVAGINYNEASFDKIRNNTDVTGLASGARTTTQTITGKNYNGKGIFVVVDMTAIGAGATWTVTIDNKDGVSGKFYTVLTGAAIAGNSTNTYRVYPGLTAVANLTVNDVITRDYRVVITVGGTAASSTFSVGIQTQL